MGKAKTVEKIFLFEHIYGCGYDHGYKDGYKDGFAAGYQHAKTECRDGIWKAGGIRAIWRPEEGYLAGKKDADAIFDQGWDQGYRRGYEDGAAGSAGTERLKP